MIVEYTLIIPNYHQSKLFIGFVSVLLPVIGIYLAVKERRDKTNFGYIKFIDAFRTGIVITFILAIMIVLFTYTYYKYINPDYVNFLAAQTEKALLYENAGRDLINVEVSLIKYKFRFDIQIIQNLLYVLLGGIVDSFIIAMILKKESKSKPE